LPASAFPEEILVRSLSLSALLIAILILGGCSLAHREHPIAKEEIPLAKEEIPQSQLQAGNGNAYLFDIKINRQGKKNSVRLELYQVGDTMSFFARGYLGKGVMKGLLSRDSLIVYFPTENEYYTGKVADLVDNPCLNTTGIEDLIIELFQGTPADSGYSDGRFYVTVLKEEPALHQYRLQSTSCPEGISLEYKLDGGRFVLNEIQLRTDDKFFEFAAHRRNVRLNVEISPEKLHLDIPETAARITP